LAKNNFTILETLRESQSTKVLKAFQPSLGRTVLLKTLHKHLVGDANLTRRFEREARACASIRSEHIVQVYDLADLDGAPAIVMEYVEGESLEEVIRKGKQSEEFARRVAAAVLKALSLAHRAGVIHRDIKPANILLDRQGVVKVADFGLASVAASPVLTAEGALVGTPAYMSPEQARGETLDGRTDLFSLGVTLLELVTGERLFTGESYAECLNKILSFNTDSLGRFSGQFSSSFLQFVRRLMMPNRENRLASAEEAHRELTGSPIGPKGAPFLTSRRGRIRAAVGAAAVLVLAAVSYVVFQPKEVEHPDEERVSLEATPAQQDSSRFDSVAQQTRTIPIGQGKETAVNQRERPGEVVSAVVPREERELPQKSEPSAAAADRGEEIDSGYVQISCTPWAKVSIGDQYLGTTPIAGSVKVKAGTHVITFNNPSFIPVVRTVTVKRGTATHVEADFLENAGYVIVVSNPWAEVYIDDQYRDTTPLAHPLVVTAGTRTIRLRNPSFEDIVTTVTVGVHDTVRLVQSFLKK